MEIQHQNQNRITVLLEEDVVHLRKIFQMIFRFRNQKKLGVSITLESGGRVQKTTSPPAQWIVLGQFPIIYQ